MPNEYEYYPDEVYEGELWGWDGAGDEPWAPEVDGYGMMGQGYDPSYYEMVMGQYPMARPFGVPRTMYPGQPRAFMPRAPMMRPPMMRPAMMRPPMMPGMMRPSLAFGRGLRGMQRAYAAPKPPMIPLISGAPPVSEKRLVIPFTSFLFTDTTPQVTTLTAQPQVNLRGARPITVSFPNPAASTAGKDLLITNIQIGTRSQFAGAGSIPFSAFGPAADDVWLRTDGAGPGILITMTVATTAALVAGETILATATLTADAVS